MIFSTPNIQNEYPSKNKLSKVSSFMKLLNSPLPPLMSPCPLGTCKAIDWTLRVIICFLSQLHKFWRKPNKGHSFCYSGIRKPSWGQCLCDYEYVTTQKLTPHPLKTRDKYKVGNMLLMYEFVWHRNQNSSTISCFIFVDSACRRILPVSVNFLLPKMSC